MKHVLITFLSILGGTLAGALIVSLLSRRVRQRLAYTERRINRLEQDLLNLRLWLTHDHPSP